MIVEVVPKQFFLYHHTCVPKLSKVSVQVTFIVKFQTKLSVQIIRKFSIRIQTFSCKKILPPLPVNRLKSDIGLSGLTVIFILSRVISKL